MQEFQEGDVEKDWERCFFACVSPKVCRLADLAGLALDVTSSMHLKRANSLS